MTSDTVSINAKESMLERFAKFLIFGNLALLALEYFVLPVYRAMHPGETFYDAIRMSLCVIDVIAAFFILKGRVVYGIGLIGITSLVMLLIPSNSGGYEWPPRISIIFSIVLFFWDFAVLLWLARRQGKT